MLAIVALIAAVVAVYCWQRFYAPRPGAQAPLRLTRVAFADLPGWEKSDPTDALAAFQRSCTILLAKPSDQKIGGKPYAGTMGDWRNVCGATDGNARHFFETNFTPFAVGAGDTRGGLFTGYYEPQINASREKHGAYQTPVYGPPPDLIRVDLGPFLPSLAGEHVSGQLQGRKLVPYAERAEIDANGIANAPVLFWCDDPVALFFLQIQGSGRARFDDGSVARVAYAGENGRPYTAIGRVLIATGALTRATVSLATIRAWLKAHPALAQGVMEKDQSYIFFAETPLGDDVLLGSPGSSGAKLTPRASLAVDLRLHPLGVPFYVAAEGPDPVQALMIAQDTGGAIRGAVRGDIFFGFGADAERHAGGMKAPGMLYVLLPNAIAAKIGAQKSFP